MPISIDQLSDGIFKVGQMYSFDELHPRREFINGRSIAYWLGAVRSPLPTGFASAKQLAAAMSMHYDIEEQACDEEHLRTVSVQL